VFIIAAAKNRCYGVPSRPRTGSSAADIDFFPLKICERMNICIRARYDGYQFGIQGEDGSQFGHRPAIPGADSSHSTVLNVRLDDSKFKLARLDGANVVNRTRRGLWRTSHTLCAQVLAGDLTNSFANQEIYAG
jgi:hypothetical protein